MISKDFKEMTSFINRSSFVSILLSFMLLGIVGCATVRVETRDFIISDRDLQDMNKNVPEKDLSGLMKRVGGINFSSEEFVMSDGVTLKGVIHYNSNAQGTLLVYGNNSYRVAQQGHILLKSLHTLPINIVLFDYRGYGRSDGTPSAELLKSDALEVYDNIKQKFPGKMFVHGHSFGSFVATYVAANRQPEALILEGTATSAYDFVMGMTPWYAKPFIKLDIDPAIFQYDNQRMLRQYTNSLLILVGENDSVTPPIAGKNLYLSAKSKNKKFFEVGGADHMNVMSKKYAEDVYSDFISELR